METTQRNDDDEGGAHGDKLIPEWRVGADDQVLLAGLAAVVALALALAWTIWRGDDDADLAAPFAPAAEEAAAASGVDGNDDGDGDGDAAIAGAAAAVQPTTTEAASEDTTSTTEAESDEATPTTEAEPEETTTTTEAGPVSGDVQAAVGSLAGAITGSVDDSADGAIAVLDGFVANDGERDAAEAAASAVAGITGVENNLVVLEPEVLAALGEAGVTGAAVTGEGTVVTVSGTIDSEDVRASTLAAAGEIAGVTEVVDQLDVSVTAALNTLPQVQFAYNSATILEPSFEDLMTAAALLADAGDVRIEIQGYTDVQGGASANQILSENRAEAVRSYLVDAGVDPAILTATGFGETTQFGDDLASNRLVRFQQIDG